MTREFFRRLAVLCATLFLSAPLAAQAAQRSLILATTTSTQDSGLLDALIPAFEKQAGFTVKTIAVGSGQAMAMGRRGEADVLLVHSPEAEGLFMAEGFGTRRRQVMHNDFVVLGPGSDPAKIKGAAGASAAFTRIAASASLFFSRADESGTHALEKKLWAEAAITPDGKWYQQTGLGMGQTLAVAAEKRGYTLTDRGTYLALQKGLDLEILFQGDAALKNVYHVIEVSREKFPRVNAEGARQFANFCMSEDAQKIIDAFGRDKYGQPLFFPDAMPQR